MQPFSEEANLSRRVLVAMAAEMATQGWIVSIPDLFGMGDSDGESEDITLATWRSDLTRLALRESADPSGAGSDAGALHADSPGADSSGEVSGDHLVIWGVRTGCALAVDLLARSGVDSASLLLWQPVVAGIGSPGRLRAPVDMNVSVDSGVAGVASKSAPSLDDMEPGVDAGIAVVNGYRYRQSLLDELAALRCDPPHGQDQADRPVAILHMGRRLASADAGVARSPDDGSATGVGSQGTEAAAPVRLPPAVTRLADQWRASGSRVALNPVRAEPFWSSIEPVMPQEAFSVTQAFLAEI